MATDTCVLLRKAGWTLEEIAYYLGYVTVKGSPAIQNTVRYTQVNRAQVKEKLKGDQGLRRIALVAGP